MKIIYKIKKFYPETNHISVSFCNLKDRQSIDNYKSRPVCIDELDMFDVESFSESLVDKSGLRRIDKQDKKLITLDENLPDKLDGELNIRDLIGKVIGVNYPTKIYSKIKMRRVEL